MNVYFKLRERERERKEDSFFSSNESKYVVVVKMLYIYTIYELKLLDASVLCSLAAYII